MTISVTIDGVPPKKDGANSMWRKPAEVERIRRLRVAVARAFAGAPCFEVSCRMELEVRARRSEGDLDNFVTGVCDALQAVHPNTPIAVQDWDDVEDAARPDRRIAWKDDALVDEIRASRVAIEGGERASYRLTIVGT